MTTAPAAPTTSAAPTARAAFERRRIAMRYWLLGAGWHTAAQAMDYAEQHHSGTRRDGVTPEFAHQVAIASHVRTLAPHLGSNAEAALAVAFLHDVREDYDIDDTEIREMFGDVVADAVDTMTKTFRGVRRDDVAQFARMANNPISSVVKGCDRQHNLDTMHGVFSLEKMRGYVAETRELFLPMLKQARRTFVAQEPAYENIKLTLTAQLRLLDALIEAESALAARR